MPARPSDSRSVARTSAPGARPKVRTAAAVMAAMAATRGSSAFSTASPSAGSPRGSSDFAWAIASRLPARSRWMGWTASTTPTSGRLISARRAISPIGVHPHLEDRHLVRRLQVEEGHAAGRSRSSGCPRCAGRGGCATGRRRSISLASVLPVEPVMPTTRTAERERHQAASSWRASRGSADLDQGGVVARREIDRMLDERGRGTGGDGGGDEAVPVDCSPRSATNSSSGGDGSGVDRSQAGWPSRRWAR